MVISEKLLKLAEEAEDALKEKFKHFDRVSFINTKKVLDAFREERVAEAMFAGSSGYGYDDRGRDTLDRIYAKVFNKEAALVRHTLISGTHTLSTGLFGLLRPGDVMLSVTGKPYDTLDEVIGIKDDGQNNGSLKDFGIIYKQIDLTPDGRIDIKKTVDILKKEKIKVVYIQRSKGYLDRPTLPVSEMDELYKAVKGVSDAYVFVDNCYGEFVEEKEPDADVIAGSLIKNPGGGMAETGGYLAGSARAIELISYRLTSVGIGSEAGCTLNTMKSMYKGFFYAPHTTAQALKTAALAAYIFDKLGYYTNPKWNDDRYDIIQAIHMKRGDKLCAFCRGIQAGSPVDAYVTPEPWDMPGYSDAVIMAAGTFTQGASIELSADGPMKEPYIAYFQGGLTYESGKVGILSAASQVIEN
ncbi:MAG: methionine gamma-lyase family protein [Clostridia bacterium]|nr:methionine gamma-lyase family protein [Clostridia bacterium]